MLCHITCREMYSQWAAELKVMTDRIASLRQQLYNALLDRGNPNYQLVYDGLIYSTKLENVNVVISRDISHRVINVAP